MEDVARRIGAAGGKALIVPVGASTARGALGYVHAVVELRHQVGGKARGGMRGLGGGDPQ